MSASVCGQAGMPAMHVTGGDQEDQHGTMNRGAGPWLAGLGALLVVLGLLAWTGLLSWFGRLPGDIRIDRDHVQVYVPITSMILVSVVVSLILWLISQ
jgi:hypothetical protein